MSAGAIQRDEGLLYGQSEVFLAHLRHPTKSQGLLTLPGSSGSGRLRIRQTSSIQASLHWDLHSWTCSRQRNRVTLLGSFWNRIHQTTREKRRHTETPKKRKPHRGTLTWQKGFSQGETRAKINCLRRMAKLAYLLWQEFRQHFNLKSFLCISEHKVMACVLCLNMEQRGPAPSLYVTDSEAAFMKLVGGWVGAQIGRQHAQISVGKFFLSHAFGMQTLFSQRNSHK